MDNEDVHRTPTAARRSNGMRPFVSPRGPAGAAKPSGIPRSPTPAKPFAPRKSRGSDALSGLQHLDGNVAPASTGDSGALSAVLLPNSTVNDPVLPAEPDSADDTEPSASAIQPEPVQELGAADPVGEEAVHRHSGELTDNVQVDGLAETGSGAQQSEPEPALVAHSEERESASDAVLVEEDYEPGESTSTVDEHYGMSVLGSPATTGGTSFDWNAGALASIEVEGDVDTVPETRIPSVNSSAKTPRWNDSLEVLHEEPAILDIGRVAGDGDSVEEVVARSLERVAGRVRSGSLEIPKVQLPPDEESALIAALSALRSSLSP